MNTVAGKGGLHYYYGLYYTVDPAMNDHWHQWPPPFCNQKFTDRLFQHINTCHDWPPLKHNRDQTFNTTIPLFSDQNKAEKDKRQWWSSHFWHPGIFLHVLLPGPAKISCHVGFVFKSSNFFTKHLDYILLLLYNESYFIKKYRDIICYSSQFIIY
jgi:hypothetical protein